MTHADIGGVNMEKRKSSRLPITLDVEHILGDAESCICLGQDISLGGIQLAGSAGFGWGKPRHAWLSISLPDGVERPIRALGELRYERSDVEGVLTRGYRFKYMSPRERCRFNAYVAQQQA